MIQRSCAEPVRRLRVRAPRPYQLPMAVAHLEHTQQSALTPHLTVVDYRPRSTRSECQQTLTLRHLESVKTPRAADLQNQDRGNTPLQILGYAGIFERRPDSQ